MKKLIQACCALCLSVAMIGCATTAPTRVNSVLAPITSLKTIADMTQIAFEWSPSSDPNVAGYYLYRSNSAQGSNIVAKIKDRFATHYVDTGLEPSTTYDYELRSYDANNEISARGEVVKVTTLRLIESVSFVQAISNLPARVKVIWRPHSDNRVKSYIIERNDGAGSWKKAAEVQGRLSVEYIDDGLEPDRTYQYRILVKTADGVLSTPSGVFSAKTKALPHQVSGLVATLNLPQKIRLRWEQNQNADFSHYVIYSGLTSIFLTKLATTKNTHFEDELNSNGATRYYKVTAVDKDAQESLKQDEAVAGSTLGVPHRPNLTGIFSNKGVDLMWNLDDRCVKYELYRSGNDGEIVKIVKGNRFFDNKIAPLEKYSYRIVCVDKFGLNSDKSEKVVIEAK